MKRSGRSLAALLPMMAASAFAGEPYRPTQQQLDEMLRGNTMKGIWAGRAFLQYFVPSGSRLYREQGGEESTRR